MSNAKRRDTWLSFDGFLWRNTREMLEKVLKIQPFLSWKHVVETCGNKYCLVVTGTWFIFPYIGNNHPNWLSYFSDGLKPPTRITFNFFSPICQGLPVNLLEGRICRSLWTVDWKLPVAKNSLRPTWLPFAEKLLNGLSGRMSFLNDATTISDACKYLHHANLQFLYLRPHHQ